ncbi:MAG: FtsW/RodA/SpoVE family cell cycle protein [Solirubrobacterales bacterium]|nr:FtsW/RodA/SpoVE family cell cycle protein [Solirubrobacterales bacterium]
MSARTRELFALIPASLLVTAGFLAIFLSQESLKGVGGQDELTDASLTYGGIFLGLCFAAHLVIRVRLRHADPYLFPLVAVLACFGLVMIYRIDQDLARQQAQWFVIGLGLFAATIIGLPDYRVLERYRYLIALGGIVLLVLPRAFPPTNGAYLSIKLGSLSVQPAEFAKIAIVIFLASYLRDTRQVLVLGARRFLFVTLPPLKHFGPVLAIWGAAMVLLFFIQDIGSSVMFYGGFLAILYVATNRLSFPAIGLGLFALGSYLLYQVRPTIENRVAAWRDPFDQTLYEQEVGGSYQLAQSLLAQADGGLVGRGFGGAVLDLPGGSNLLPAPHTDFIYAVIVNELGLAGGLALLLVFLLIVQRGFKVAMLARDSFSKLLAAGLTSVLALQVFVIVGGVTKLIPLTGVTLPFVSYGGSSIMANFILLALLLLVSDRARREA